MKDITDPAFQAEVCNVLAAFCQPQTRPNQGIVGQSFQLGQDLLAGKRFLLRLVVFKPCLSSLISISTPPPR